MIESNNAYMDSLDAHQTMSKQALQDPYVNSQVMNLLIEKFGLWEELRERAAS